MRQRPSPEHQREHPAEHKQQESRVRIPKIQYRFLKEIEENGVADGARGDALAMADKIRRFPLEEKHVMGSWERFTRKAIEEFKRGANGTENDRQHTAYAVLFSALRAGGAVKSADELKARVADVAGAPARLAVADPSKAREPVPPRQQELLQPERTLVERQIDAALTRLRDLAPQLRSTIEESARNLLTSGQLTPASARAELPNAVRQLKADASEANTSRALSLSLIARAQDHKELVVEARRLSGDDGRNLHSYANVRVQPYTPVDAQSVDAVKRDATTAALRDALYASPHTHNEALLMASVRAQIEAHGDPKQGSIGHVALQLAAELP